MFIELNLTGENGKAYFDPKQISVVTVSGSLFDAGETQVFIGEGLCFNVKETPEEVLNKIQNAK